MKFTKERKWETSKTELAFEEMLKSFGYEVIGIKEHVSKTDYLIEKDGIECEFAVYAASPDGKKRAEICFGTFEKFFDIKKRYEAIAE